MAAVPTARSCRFRSRTGSGCRGRGDGFRRRFFAVDAASSFVFPVLDLDRFTVKARWWLVGAAMGIWLLLLFVVIPETCWLLDRAEVLGAAAISGTPSVSAGEAAYTLGLTPFAVGVPWILLAGAYL